MSESIQRETCLRCERPRATDIDCDRKCPDVDPCAHCMALCWADYSFGCESAEATIVRLRADRDALRSAAAELLEAMGALDRPSRGADAWIERDRAFVIARARLRGLVG